MQYQYRSYRLTGNISSFQYEDQLAPAQIPLNESPWTLANVRSSIDFGGFRLSGDIRNLWNKNFQEIVGVQQNGQWILSDIEYGPDNR